MNICPFKVSSMNAIVTSLVTMAPIGPGIVGTQQGFFSVAILNNRLLAVVAKDWCISYFKSICGHYQAGISVCNFW